MSFTNQDWQDALIAAELEPGPLRVLTALAVAADETGMVRMAIGELVGVLGTNERTVRRWLDVAMDAGLVSKPSRSGRQVATRKLIVPDSVMSTQAVVLSDSLGELLSGHSSGHDVQSNGVSSGHSSGHDPGSSGHATRAPALARPVVISSTTRQFEWTDSSVGDGCLSTQTPSTTSAREGFEWTSQDRSEADFDRTSGPSGHGPEWTSDDLRPVPVSRSEGVVEPHPRILRPSPLCRACGRMLDQALIDGGETEHPSCDAGNPAGGQFRDASRPTVSGDARRAGWNLPPLDPELNRRGIAACRAALAEARARRQAREDADAAAGPYRTPVDPNSPSEQIRARAVQMAHRLKYGAESPSPAKSAVEGTVGWDDL